MFIVGEIVILFENTRVSGAVLLPFSTEIRCADAMSAAGCSPAIAASLARLQSRSQCGLKQAMESVPAATALTCIRMEYDMS